MRRSWVRRTSDRTRAHRANRMRAHARHLGQCRHRAHGRPARRRRHRQRAQRRSGRPTRRRCGCRRPTAMPGYGSHVRSSTPPARRRHAPDPWRLLGSRGGIDVVIDRPPVELRDRQHRAPTGDGDGHRQVAMVLWHVLCHNRLALLCKCAVHFLRQVDGEMGEARLVVRMEVWMTQLGIEGADWRQKSMISLGNWGVRRMMIRTLTGASSTHTWCSKRGAESDCRITG